MKNYKIITFIALTLTLAVLSCKKEDFLNEKPSSDISEPTTIQDFRQLLEDTETLNSTGGLAQMGSDDYFVSDADYLTATTTERNSYIWAKDIYGGDVAIPDWNKIFKQVFSANVVLDGLKNSEIGNTADGQYLKGWALFCRAFAFYDLTRTFCKPYDAATASSDPGIPLRLSSSIDYLEQRATLQQTFDRIFADLNESLSLLPSLRPSGNLNRPSTIAAYALLARIYLDMRKYQEAELNADKSLALYSTLIDYNTVSTTSTTPFSRTNDELIYQSRQVFNYSSMTINTTGTKSKISTELLSLYDANDLRKPIYFRLLADGVTYGKKIGYNGGGNYHFTGLATDELYLIKAECLARRNETQAAMDKLNQLLIKRFSNKSAYVTMTASSGTDAVSKIIVERRKELVWRGLRWQDIRRLNKEGFGITLTRTLNGTTYTLPPNDPRYVFPIPDDEIALSGIQQNIR